MPHLLPSQVDHLADLARLPLSDEQKKHFASQLADILGYVEQISVLSAKDAAVNQTINGLTNVLRSDDQRDICLSSHEALKNAPDINDGYFKVKAIFEN